MLLLAREAAGAILGDAGMTILIGLIVVFAVLLLLTFVFKLFGVIMGSRKKKAPEDKPTASAASATPAAVPVVGNTETTTAKPEVQNGIPEETVAVISAAVASVAPAGIQYTVRGIRKKQ